MKSFLDFKHRAEALAKSGGKATADAYREAFHAKSVPDIALIRPDWSADVRRRIGAEEDAVQFPPRASPPAGHFEGTRGARQSSRATRP